MRSTRADRLQPPAPCFFISHCSRMISAIGSVRHMCLFWLAHIRVQLPWKMSSWSKWVPLLPSLGFQAEFAHCFGGKRAMLLWPCMWTCVCATDARAHTCMASEIVESGFVKVTEKVGRFIVQPCVLVHTWACEHMLLLQVCVGALAWLFKNSLLQTDACLLSQGSQASLRTYLCTLPFDSGKESWTLGWFTMRYTINDL